MKDLTRGVISFEVLFFQRLNLRGVDGKRLVTFIQQLQYTGHSALYFITPTLHDSVLQTASHDQEKEVVGGIN